MKIRINDLARELEVKSKQILDVLADVGVTEKKTHSSSLEADEADRVRNKLGRPGGASGETSRARATHSREPELKPKFDFSKISKPGDALKAIKEKQAAPEHKDAPREVAASPAKPAARPAVPTATKPQAPSATASQAAQSDVEASAPPSRAARSQAQEPARERRLVTPDLSRPKPIYTVPTAVPPSQKPPAPDAGRPIAVPPSQASPHPTVTEKPAAEAPLAAAPPEAEAPSAQPDEAASQAPAPPGRRLITPNTGPRPVYTATHPLPQRGQPIGPRPGQQGRPPMAGGGPGGAPERGKPIFQRPGAPGQRPFTPGQRPPYGGGGSGGPGGPRRGPHPTSGARPGMGGGPRPFGAPGMIPPPPGGAPGQRPGGRPPARRGAPRYEKNQEGPMKRFVPPPRFGTPTAPLPITRSITITEGVSLKDLAEKLDVRAKDLIAALLGRGVFATVNQTLDAELAKDLARQFGADTDVISFEQQAQAELDKEGLGADVKKGEQVRPPVVTIMGHVDHGKTSLLDSIRLANVAGGEAGGITQHIGAYQVSITDAESPAYGRTITFIDTPGHEAFTRMRARGAKVTDIVIIVVAADDGVMPQTLEAIDHATAAKVPLIIAVNKVDKPDAQPDRVKKQLADRGLMPEDWGGTTVFVEVSAKTKKNLNLLLEMVCLVADLQEIKATPDRPAVGSVLEAQVDRGRGNVATVLVQNGTLRIGDTFIVGNMFGKVRAMFDDHGRAIEVAPPSMPVEVLGLEGLPQAGDQLLVADREKAKQISTWREQRAREAALAKSSRVSLESLSEQIASAGVKELPIILKGDVQGSVEVLADSLQKLSTEKVKVKVMRTGAGAITESDVLLATASDAIIIGFNVRPERKAQEMAEQEKIDIRLHSIIYELQDEIRKAMTGLLEPIIKETYQGRAQVRETFRVPRVGTIAGCSVLDGAIKRDSEVRLLRDNVQVFKGRIGSLRRFKDDVSEVRNGQECGIGIAGYGDIKAGDVIEAFVTERIAAELTA